LLLETFLIDFGVEFNDTDGNFPRGDDIITLFFEFDVGVDRFDLDNSSLLCLDLIFMAGDLKLRPLSLLYVTNSSSELWAGSDWGFASLYSTGRGNDATSASDK
jgi:hypothetical protein